MISQHADAISLDRYASNPGSFDELRAEGGELRPQWNELFNVIHRVGSGEFSRRWEQATRILRENDVTFNTGASDGNQEAAWSVDPIPLIIPPNDWAGIESGLKQRASLLNSVIADLHGQQRLIRNGVLPPDLLFANSAFLRPCHGMQVPQGAWLHLYAVDLVRTPQGGWAVLADRAQAPYGAGYALENRIVLSRTFPDIFHSFNVRRLVTFFKTLQSSLRQLAPHNRDYPRVVLLSPGTYSTNYFEQIYLARYLGIPLVEGADLTSRDNCIYLKTISGLQLVDIVLRHVNDSLCDPLELRYDSNVGVAGLVQAAHAGNVVVMNALGSGIAGSYSISAYLNAACEYLRGTPLAMQSVKTLWCGDDEQREEAFADLRRYVIKGASPGVTDSPTFCCQLDDSAIADLQERIEARPYDYVAQENVSASDIPAWGINGIEARPMVLRVYAVWSPDGYHVMPGGLVRLAQRENAQVSRTNSSLGSKDAWVLSDQPVASATMLTHSSRILALNRHSTDQPSRVADNMYWLGRYVERAEQIVRILRAVLNRALEDTANEDMPEFPLLLKVLSIQGIIPEDTVVFGQAGWEQTLESELLLALCDGNRSGSLRSIVDDLRRTGWIVRDRLSQDSWRTIHLLDTDVPESIQGLTPGDANTLLNRLLLPLSAFAGLAMENMTRGFGWRFLDIGRRVERCSNMITLLHTMLRQEQPGSDAILQALLEIADSSMTYRYRYLSTMQTDAVLDLLLLDPANPRSMAFQLFALSDHVASLPHDTAKIEPTSPDDFMNRLLQHIRMSDIGHLAEADDEGLRRDLDSMLNDMMELIPELSNAISRRFFSHTQSVRQIEFMTGRAEQ